LASLRIKCSSVEPSSTSTKMIREQWMIEVVTDQTGIVKDSGLVYKRKFALDEEIPMILRQEECLRNDSETTEKNQCEKKTI